MNTLSSITAIILTLNEEKNIEECLQSIFPSGINILVVDSFSSDQTIKILESYKITYLQHEFKDYSAQRNWAQENNPFKTDWVFHLDAGERFTPELTNWLKSNTQLMSDYDGFMFSRKTMIFNKWIKYGGHYPNYHLRLYKIKNGFCESKLYDQHFNVNGKVKVVKKGVDIIDTVLDDWITFTINHAKWSVYEAIDTINRVQNDQGVQSKFFGTPIQRQRWLKKHIFEKSPLFLRSFLYFFYRYIIRLGFLDGKTGLAFHLLQGFWFRFLIDATILELKYKMAIHKKSLVEIIKDNYDPKFQKLFQ